MKISESFQKAKEVLLTGGWYQGAATGPHGERCLVTALQTATYDDYYPTTIGGFEFLDDYIEKKKKVGPKGSLRPAANRNDNHAKDLNEVIDLLDDATIAAKEEGR